MSISDETRDRVLFQGDLGSINIVSIIDGTALEVIGSNGVLRLEISEEILEHVLFSFNRELRLSPRKGEKTERIGR